MSFWKIIKELNYKQLTSLVGLFFRHPLYMIGTLQATLLTFQISQRTFPNIHGKHNKANAFRHALWNLLIAKKCAQFSNNQKSVLSWTKKITDWHEEFAPNEKLAKTMDLHNNRIGRDLYAQLSQKTVQEIEVFIIQQLNTAIKIKNIEKIENHTNQLVYLED